jgi:adenosylcobyric acid synthase
MVHGIFENDSLRAALLRSLRRRRGLPDPATPGPSVPKQDEFDRLAAMLREHLDLPELRRLAGLSD